MGTYDNYVNQIKNENTELSVEVEAIEKVAQIVSVIINKRNELGLSQRDLAKLCHLPQSSVARIENANVTPNLLTVMKICKPLGLTITIN